MKKTLMALAAVVGGMELQGATVTIPATADTALHELFSDSNMGGTLFMVAGATKNIFDGFSTYARMRGLIRFDLGGQIPAGAVVSGVKVNMSVTFKPTPGPAPGSMFALHRMLKDWTEGTKVGVGTSATAGEATWIGPKGNATAWEAPGAGGSGDAAAEASSAVFMDTVGRYAFPTSAELVADVQGWVDQPASNFGWLMKSTSEDVGQTGRRFGAREDAGARATLEVTYSLPAAEVRITEYRVTAGAMFLAWTGGNPPYRVQRAASASGPWEFLAENPASAGTSATVSLGNPFAFYRVASEVP